MIWNTFYISLQQLDPVDAKGTMEDSKVKY